jgi:hypothetical protein
MGVHHNPPADSRPPLLRPMGAPAPSRAGKTAAPPPAPPAPPAGTGRTDTSLSPADSASGTAA